MRIVCNAVLGYKVLPDGHGIPTTTQSLLELAVWLAGTGDPILIARWK
ncbi:MAG TPA: hypothetical protein VK818_10570 [Methylomirabilota bacterium]|jgi:hypothetical protein|nr:hypothetical protein [Methylomirabilota bacterium]